MKINLDNEILESKVTQRISLLNKLLLDKNLTIKKMKNIGLMDIELIGNHTIQINDPDHYCECSKWSPKLKKLYLELFKKSDLQFTKKEAFKINYFKGIELLDKYCANT